MSVVTRFAPSPTGFLHIGGARTALFNWLFAKRHGGQFLLRIEDTDKERSTEEAKAAILDGMSWLNLSHDGAVHYQSAYASRHAEVAESLLASGAAYRCYCSPEELQAMRDSARAEGRPIRYDGTWRDRDPADAPVGVAPVVRLKAPQDGETVIKDLVQGEVTVSNTQSDDMILLRSDGSPTYMLSVVVDDHDMGVTHVIRGDDHLNNAFRQFHLYQACGWDVPEFAHIPLIHGPDGAKLSKRHGALGVDAYRDMGYLPDAVCNYLLRLGWAHGDDEIIERSQAIEWFDLDGCGKAPSRFDFAKLENLNGHYMRMAENADLLSLVEPFMAKADAGPLDTVAKKRLSDGLGGLKERAKTLIELAENAEFYRSRPSLPLANEKAAKAFSEAGVSLLKAAQEALLLAEDWSAEGLQDVMKGLAEANEVGLGKVMQPLRSALTGSNASPSVFEIFEILGREEVLGRVEASLAEYEASDVS